MGSVKARGNITINAFGRIWEAHRLAWLYQYGSFPAKNIDHINGNPGDNRICNLRDVSQAENSRNMCMSKKNKTGVNGVHRNTQDGRFTVQIRVNGKTTHIGVFDDLKDAAEARKTAELRHGYHANHGRAPSKTA